MTNQEILFSFGSYLKIKNPTSVQVGINGKNFETGALMSEEEDYLNVTEGINHYNIDGVGDNSLKIFNLILTLRYGKGTKAFNKDEISIQKFIEGDGTNKLNGVFNAYDLSTDPETILPKKIYVDYSKVSSPIILLNDNTSRILFWIVPITHSN